MEIKEPVSTGTLYTSTEEEVAIDDNRIKSIQRDNIIIESQLAGSGSMKYFLASSSATDKKLIVKSVSGKDTHADLYIKYVVFVCFYCRNCSVNKPKRPCSNDIFSTECNSNCNFIVVSLSNEQTVKKFRMNYFVKDTEE